MLCWKKSGTQRCVSDTVVVLCCVACCRLLGALCRCICDPQLNAVSQEMRPAESLGQLLLFHLNSKSALQRVTVALVLCEWAALQKVGRSRSGALPESVHLVNVGVCLSGLSAGVVCGAAPSSGHFVGAVVLR